MAKLEAMLEQRGIATPRELSEAVARCQLHGGDLTTSLLQFVSADEARLSAAVSECYGLPAASVGLLPAPDDAALRSLPRDIAERYCCFPIAASPGRLVLAVAHPLEPALREELGATLGVAIEERVGLEVRIRQALARFYGLPLSARNQRGIARLEGDLEAVGQETPLGLWSDTQLSTLPRPPSELPAGHRDSQRPPSVRPRQRSEQPRLSSPPPSSGSRASRRRGPMTLVQAREELARTASRNDVLDIFFAFASQFFEYSALFAVHNALAEGLDAWGKGADRDTMLGIGVPLDLPSSLSEAAESCKVRLTRLGKEGIDRTLMTDLQRQFNNKALVLPVSLRGRCAVLLYADNGEADVVEREAADVIAIAPDVANALGRIILQRKREIARQRAPENSDLPASLGPRRPSSSLEAPEQISNENRDKSRNNARRGSRPDASPAALRSEPQNGSVQAQHVVAIGAESAHAPRSRPSSSPTAAGRPGQSPPDSSKASEPSSGEDPVFLLSSPRSRARVSALPPQPRLSFPPVEKPPVAITHPARIIGNRPRLPSVIVEPESADPEASERLTRAAAVTRAPTQARSSASVRRPLVPPAADAPRTISPPENPRPRPAVFASNPDPTPAFDSTASTDASEAELALAEEEALAEEAALGATAAIGWPPPIMDNSPPPRQQALTALVPIIIADPPKGRRGYTNSRNTAPARAGAKPGFARSGPHRPSSSPPSNDPGPASPTVPSPARSRKLDTSPGAGGHAAAAVSRSLAMETPTIPAPASPPHTAGSAAQAHPSASTSADARGVPATGDRVHATATASNAAPPPHTNALARAAARAAASSPSTSDNSQRSTASTNEPRVASSPFAAGPSPAPLRDSRPPAPSAAFPRAPSAAPLRSPSAAPAPRPTATGLLPSRPQPTAQAPSAPLVSPPAEAAPADGSRATSGEDARGSGPAPAPASTMEHGASPSSAEALHAPPRSVPITYVRSSAPTQPPRAAATTTTSAPTTASTSAPATATTVPALRARSTGEQTGGDVAVATVPSSTPAKPATPASAPAAAPAPAAAAPAALTPPSAAASDPAATSAPANATSERPLLTSSFPPDDASPESDALNAGWFTTGPGAVTTSAPASPRPAADSGTAAADSVAPASSSSPPVATPSSASDAAQPAATPASEAATASVGGSLTPPASAASSPTIWRTSVAPSALQALGGAGERPAMFPPPPPDDSELEELVERVCQGNLKAVQEIARIGAPSLPQVMARFPGPVISERAGPTSRASECGPLLQALAAMGIPAMTVITRSSENEDARVRRWATLLLGEMPGPEACRAVVQRLADDVPRVHQAALDAARLLLASPAADLFRKTLFEVAEADEAPLTLRLRTLEHVAKLKDSASVPRLIAFLGADMEPIMHKALWALTVVTRHDFGRDARAWTDFWHSNQSRHRVEWLIDALDDRDPRLRKAAADELRDEAGELFGYAENLARPERLEAQKKFRDWWQNSGGARHGR